MRKNLFSFLLIPILLISVHPEIFSQEEPEDTRFLVPAASYTGDNFFCLMGGNSHGYSYLGLATLRLGFDSETAGLWKGGEMMVCAEGSHGSMPSASMIGDIQGVSNIEAGDHVFLHELWFRQAVGSLQFTIGLQDLNIEFANSGPGSLLINSSFGIMPVITGNLAAPVFPVTAAGLTVKWDISERSSVLAAVYDACSPGFEGDPYKIRWDIRPCDGYLVITEFQQQVMLNDHPGTIKAGIVATTGAITNINDPEQSAAGYIIADQNIFQNDKQSADIFMEAGYSPSRYATIGWFLGGGIGLRGVFSRKDRDNLTVACASAHINEFSKQETTIEASYRFNLNENIFIQPDIQYVINPSGTGHVLPSCFCGILRFGVIL